MAHKGKGSEKVTLNNHLNISAMDHEEKESEKVTLYNQKVSDNVRHCRQLQGMFDNIFILTART